MLYLTSQNLPVAYCVAPGCFRLLIGSALNTRRTMERYLTVSIDRHGRGQTSASSSVLSTLSGTGGGGGAEDDQALRLQLSRSRHSVDCSGLMTSPRQATSTSRSTSRLHLGVPSDLRRSSLQTDRHHHHHHRHRCPRQHSAADSTCDAGGCAQSSGSRSSVALTDDESNAGRRVSFGSSAPLRSTANVSTPRENTIFDIGADLIKVSTTKNPLSGLT